MDLGINNNFRDLINTFFKQITELGSLVITAVIILAAYFFHKDIAIRMFIGIIAVTIISIIIKSLFFYERPDKHKIKTLIDRIDASSFPSVHSARITVLVYWFVNYTHNIMTHVTFIIIGVLVLYSRIYLKKHYFRDVLAGMILGLIVSMITNYFIY
jgi:undecaprenyl-diphosphatase